MIINKIYAVIPARSGSKGIPDKNIQLLNGKPLIAYSIETAKEVPGIDRIIVSTDSELYAKISKDYGAEILFLRPLEISGDNSTDIEWVIHLLSWLENNEKDLPEYLIHLRPTCPLRNSEYINKAIIEIKQHPEATSLRSVHEMSQTVYKDFEIENGFLRSVVSKSFNIDEFNKPRHLYPKTYEANGYVDILRTSYIIEHKKILGNKVIPFHIPSVIDIDSRKELEYVKYELIKKGVK